MIIQRDDLHKAIDKLPESALIELAKFVDFLQFKSHYDEQPGDLWNLSEDKTAYRQSEKVDEPSLFSPVHFAEGVIKGIDFSPEYIAEVRKELWANFREDAE